MSVSAVKSTFNKGFKYASPMVIVHTRILMAQKRECYNQCMSLPSLASKSMMCAVGKIFQPNLSESCDLCGGSTPTS